MLSWKKHTTSTRLAMSTRTNLGTALITVQDDGQAAMDMWRPDGSEIGRGLFPNLDAAKLRAEAVLDPRATAWDMLDDIMLGDPEDDGFAETGT